MLERDNLRLGGMLCVERKRVDRLWHSMSYTQKVYKTEFLTLGSSDIFHQKEGWILQDVHRQPRIKQTNREEPLPLPSIGTIMMQKEKIHETRVEALKKKNVKDENLHGMDKEFENRLDGTLFTRRRS
ncbi:hypothetical protein Tco_0596277 [Tanacetum coccineum]